MIPVHDTLNDKLQYEGIFSFAFDIHESSNRDQWQL